MNKIARSTSVTAVSAMSDAELIRNAWSILTNVRQCGGGSVKGRKLAQRRIRSLGVRFYLLLGTDYNEWGYIKSGDRLPEGGRLFTGVTLNHCAAKIGGGCAKRGWDIYWGQR